jgi:hypothetical protein
MKTLAATACLLALFLLPAQAVADRDTILLDYMPTGRIIRIEDGVRYWVGGKDRLEGTYYVETVVGELRRIIPRLPFRQVSSASQANVRIYLTDSHEEWQETIAKSAEGMAGWEEIGHLIRGFTRTVTSPDGSVRRADVVLHLDFQTSGGQKLWIVRHEFMHALGVMHHPKATQDSVLNSMQEQHNKNSEFSDADILVLQTMYGPGASPGGSW